VGGTGAAHTLGGYKQTPRVALFTIDVDG
jgi:hypothetical protein